MNQDKSQPEPPHPPPLPADHADNPDFRNDRTDQGLSGADTANTPQILSEVPSKISLHHIFLSRKHRTLLASFGVFLLSGFLLSVYLKPSPAGYGTHQKLGLPPCSMRVMFEIPCPSCGMTTSFSHFVRGQIPSSMRANAAGTLLAVVCVVLMIWSFLTAWQGRYMWVHDPATTLAYGLSGVAALTLLHWVWRLWTDGYI